MIRRIIAVLTASVTIISAMSFICFAAGKTVNVKVPAPQAGKSPDFRFEIEDEDFLPGSLPLIAGGFWRDAETAYLTCEGKIPELKEAASINMYITLTAMLRILSDAPLYAGWQRKE